MVITLVFGTAAFLLEYKKIGAVVADRAQRRVAIINAQTQHLLDRSIVIDDAGTLELARLHDQEYEYSDAVELIMETNN